MRIIITTFVFLTTAVGHPLAQTPPATDLRRAEALFREAREAITGLAPEEATGLQLILAQMEARAFPDAAADDASRAFQIALALPGGGPGVDLSSFAPRAAAVGRMMKNMIEPEAIKVNLQAKQEAHALNLARQGDIDCAELFGPIVAGAGADQVLTFGAECRRRDGTYPYLAIAERAYTLPADMPQRRAIVEQAYAALASDATFKGRSLALSFVINSWTCRLATPDVAEAGLASLMQAFLTEPAKDAAGRSEADSFGPRLLEWMMLISPQKAATIATEHPDWEAARSKKGEPVCPYPDGVFPSESAPHLFVRPTLLGSAAEFDRAVADARQLTSAPARIEKVISLAGGLLGR